MGFALVPNDSALTFVAVAPFLEPANFAVNRAKSFGSSELHPGRFLPCSASGAGQFSGGVALCFFTSFGASLVGKVVVPNSPFPLNGGTSSNATSLE